MSFGNLLLKVLMKRKILMLVVSAFYFLSLVSAIKPFYANPDAETEPQLPSQPKERSPFDEALDKLKDFFDNFDPFAPEFNSMPLEDLMLLESLMSSPSFMLPNTFMPRTILNQIKPPEMDANEDFDFSFDGELEKYKKFHEFPFDYENFIESLDAKLAQGFNPFEEIMVPIVDMPTPIAESVSANPKNSAPGSSKSFTEKLGAFWGKFCDAVLYASAFFLSTIENVAIFIMIAAVVLLGGSWIYVSRRREHIKLSPKLSEPVEISLKKAVLCEENKRLLSSAQHADHLLNQNTCYEV